MKLMRITLAIAIGVLAQTTFAQNEVQVYGAVSGGGGKGVVCKQNSSKAPTVELLDIWEARTFNQGSLEASTGNLASDVDRLLIRMKDSYRFNGSGGVDDSGTIYQGQDYILAFLRSEAKRFLTSNVNVLRLHGVTLTLTDDSYELAKPVDCEIQQIVNYQPTGRILMNQDLFELMDDINQAALIAHEAFYSMLRIFAHETNSIRTRRAVGYVLSGSALFLYPEIEPSNGTVCVSSEVPLSKNRIVIYQGTDPGSVELFPTRLGGSAFIGISGVPKMTFGSPGLNQIILSGKCDANDFLMEAARGMDGPVEFDHEFRLTWSCSHGKFSLTLENSKPGSSTVEQSALTCSSYLKN